MKNKIIFGEIIKSLEFVETDSQNMVYINFPNKLSKIPSGKRKKEYYHYLDFLQEIRYDGNISEYLLSCVPIIIEAKRVLKATGVLYVRGNFKFQQYIKTLILDKIFGKKLFYNEIIWVGDRESKIGLWPSKHENILMYVNSLDFEFQTEEVDRIEYMAPALQKESNRGKKKYPTDTWWYTQITESEMLKRLIVSSTNKNENVLGVFTGGFEFMKVAIGSKRNCTLIEKSKISATKIWNEFGENINWVGEKIYE